MRPQKARNAERASQGKVARNRYRGAEERGKVAPRPGLITGHQKRSPATKNVRCCTPCHGCDRMLSSSAGGTCNAMTTPVPTSQHRTGCVSERPSRRAAVERSSMTAAPRAGCGKPRRNATRGVPRRISGAATVIKRRCCTMWNVSSAWSNAARGDAITIQRTSIPPATVHVDLRRCIEDGGPRGVVRGRLPGRMERLEECHERSGLRRAEVLSIARHVATALDHLADQLVLREPDGDSIERRPALPSRAFERVAVAALLELQDERSVSLERAAAVQVLLRDRFSAPRVHHRAPRRVPAEMSETAERHSGQQDGQHCDGPALPALLAFAGEEGKREQHAETDRRADQQDRCFRRGWKIGQQRI